MSKAKAKTAAPAPASSSIEVQGLGIIQSCKAAASAFIKILAATERGTDALYNVADAAAVATEQLPPAAAKLKFD